MRTLVKSSTKPVRIFQQIVTSGLLLPSWKKPMETPRWWRKSSTEPSHPLGLTGWKSTESNGYRYGLGLGLATQVNPSGSVFEGYTVGSSYSALGLPTLEPCGNTISETKTQRRDKGRFKQYSRVSLCVLS